MNQFGSKVAPPSNENDCSQRADDGVMSVQSKRTLTVASAERVVALEAALAVAEAADDRRVELPRPVVDAHQIRQRPDLGIEEPQAETRRSPGRSGKVGRRVEVVVPEPAEDRAPLDRRLELQPLGGSSASGSPSLRLARSPLAEEEVEVVPAVGLGLGGSVASSVMVSPFWRATAVHEGSRRRARDAAASARPSSTPSRGSRRTVTNTARPRAPAGLGTCSRSPRSRRSRGRCRRARRSCARRRPRRRLRAA